MEKKSCARERQTETDRDRENVIKPCRVKKLTIREKKMERISWIQTKER